MSADQLEHTRSMLINKGVDIEKLSDRLFGDADKLVEANNKSLEMQLQNLRVQMLGNNLDLPKDQKTDAEKQ